LEKLQISLAAARVNAGMTQADVAGKMHLNKQTIVNWENNRVIPKPAQLEMMSRIYNIPLDNIFLPTKSTIS
jgi:DNA-binding XRE family transcriptional regulator